MKKPILHELFMMEIQDLYDSEQQILDALPKMEDSAMTEDLKAGFNKHFAQTEEHVARLEEIAESLEFDVEGETCEGMEGILSEGTEVMDLDLTGDVKDLAMIGEARRVEHYEIAGYRFSIALAKAMGHDEAAKLLQKTLDEEEETDKVLTGAADSIVKGISDDE